jgi:hypothetical protein
MLNVFSLFTVINEFVVSTKVERFHQIIAATSVTNLVTGSKIALRIFLEKDLTTSSRDQRAKR